MSTPKAPLTAAHRALIRALARRAAERHLTAQRQRESQESLERPNRVALTRNERAA